VPPTVAYSNANFLQRLLRRFGGSGPGSWLFARLMHHIDRPVYRLTGGRHTAGSLLSGLPIVMLTTTGARSGNRRTVPVLGLPAAGEIAVVASNFGQERNPAWLHNLRANPEGELSVHGESRAFRAVEVEGELRTEVWNAGLSIYPGFAQYERRASHRHIAVFVLERA
jgi:deazaflavin-dependent oxidoreductase (nitroreductase family)